MEDKYPTCNTPSDEAAGGFFLESEEVSVEVTHLLSEGEMDTVIENMAREIAGDCGDESPIVLVGIKSRGVPLASWLGTKLKSTCKKEVAIGSLNINLYRDDLSEVDDQPVVQRTELPIPISGKGVILVDDVLYTGRTVRAAMDALMDFGRPKFIRLAVMIDRGFRELPIQADYIGKKVETTATQNVKVMLHDTDGKNQVFIKG